MLIEKNGNIIRTDDFKKYDAGANQYFVKGFLYVPGFRAGEESIHQIQAKSDADGIIPFDDIYGAYICCIKRRDDILLFACNSEMHCLYVSENAAGNSFLEHLDYLKKHNLKRTFSDESVCQYITLGKVFFKKTFVNEISMLPNSQYLRFHSGEIEILNKPIEDVDGESHIKDPRKFFEQLAYAMQDMKVCSSLTGGYDSRMVVSMLYKNVPLKLYYSSNDPNDIESRAAKSVANVIDKPLSIYHTEKPKLTEILLWELITNTDGMTPLSLNGSFRIQNFRKELQKEGYNLGLTGDGGVLHKDWEWMQDLPFYHKKHTDLKKFYHQRIAFERNAGDVGSRLESIYKRQEAMFIEKLRPFAREINTKSYDFLYHYVSGSQCLGYNYDSAVFSSYAPLWELDLVRYSYHLPRGKRFFYNFIREMTTSANPEIAKLPTNYGTTASSQGKYLFRDVFYQIGEYAKKGILLIGRMLFHKSFIVGKNVDWSLENDLRSLPTAKQAVEWGKADNFINQALNEDTITYPTLTRLVHLYLLKTSYDIIVL